MTVTVTCDTVSPRETLWLWGSNASRWCKEQGAVECGVVAVETMVFRFATKKQRSSNNITLSISMMARVGSSALVNVAEDAELRLVRHLSETAESVSSSFVQECEACISGGDAAKLLATIVGEVGAIRALSLDDEAVSVVSLLGALLDRAKDSRLVDALADSLVQVSTDASKTISLLATLYNMRSDAVEKVGLMVKMIRLAAERQPALLEPHASVLGKWMDASRLQMMMDEWKVESVTRRPLYFAASIGAPTAVAKQRFTLLVLETYSSSVSVLRETGILLHFFI